MSKATLTIASKNYGSWSLRGWLLCKMANLDFDEQHVGTDDPSTRAELLLLSPSFLVPCLTHDGLKVWDTLAIAEYLHEIKPGSRPAAGRPGAARPLPRHLRRDAFRLQQSALGAADESEGAFPRLQIVGRRARRHRSRHRDLAGMPRQVRRPLSVRGKSRAPRTPCTRRSARAFLTYDVALDPVSAQYCRTIMALPQMQEWIAAAKVEPDELEELDVEF